MKRSPEFFCVVEFGGTERTITAALTVGALRRVSLPAIITWPDGSKTSYLDVLIEQMPDRLNSPASAPLQAE